MHRNYDEEVARWGIPPEPIALSPAARDYLVREVGPAVAAPAAGRAVIAVPPSRLTSDAAEDLRATGATLDLGDDARLEYGAGFSYLDLMARRGASPPVTDAVITPGHSRHVRDVLRVAQEHDLALVPFGGGTSVVGGVKPDIGRHRAVVAVSLEGMAELIAVDEVDMTVTVGPGMTGPVLERLLGARGLTLGHFPQSWERASIGGYAATRSAGQASSGYGRSDEMIEALNIATPKGDFDLGRAPMSAAGPDLRQLFIGSEGAFGIITEITLRIRHVAPVRRYEGVMFADYGSALDCFREIEQRRCASDVMRLSDPAETATSLALSVSPKKAALLDKYVRLRGVKEPCLGIFGWEGTRTQVRSRRDETWRVLRRARAVGLGSKVGESWRHGRFGGPYLRDVLMDAGYLVETLETATTWRRLPRLRSDVVTEVEGALGADGVHPLVMSHLSHVYESGGSLYVTVVAPMDPADPVGQWRRAKEAACDVIASHGATITHHHGVGRDHAPWLSGDIGTTGVDLLRAVKAHLDPQDVLNPGVLVGG